MTAAPVPNLPKISKLPTAHFSELLPDEAAKQKEIASILSMGLPMARLEMSLSQWLNDGSLAMAEVIVRAAESKGFRSSPAFVDTPHVKHIHLLGRACSQLDLRTATFLLEHGADVRRLHDGKSFLFGALLANPGPSDGNGRSWRDARAQSFIDLGLQHGMDVFERDGHGRTALHTAAAQGLDGCAGKLMGLGLSQNINTADNFGQTPLHCAAKQNHSSMAALLIDAGARLDISSKERLTPPGAAARARHKALSADMKARGHAREALRAVDQLIETQGTALAGHQCPVVKR